MVLSRFWILVLAVAAVAAAGAALLAQGMVNRQLDGDLVDGLRRDRFEVEQTLKLDARSRLDAIGPIAAQQDVRTILRQASARHDDAQLVEMNGRLKTKLQELNRQLAGMSADILFAVDANGIVIAQLGPAEARFGGGLSTFPLVERALAGYVRDDVWVYDGNVYRMAARPVIDAGLYVGAIVHGKKLDEGLAQILSQRLNGASVAFFRDATVIASYSPSDVAGAPDQSSMAAPLTGLVNDAHLAAGERTDPIDLQGRGKAVYSLVTGSAADAHVGYAIARRADHIATPVELITRATKDDFKALPLPYLGGGGGLVFLLGMLWVWLERDRPLRNLRKGTAALAGRQIDRLDIAAYGGAHRRIAENVNQAIDKAVEQAAELAPKKKANLDEILGPAPGAAGQPQSFFAFGGGSAPSDAANEIPDIPPAPLAAPAPAPIAARAAPAPAPAPAFAPPAPAPPMPAARPAAPAPPPPRPAAPAPPMPRPAAPAPTLHASPAIAPGPPMTRPVQKPVTATAPWPAAASGIPKGTLIGMPAESLTGGGGPVQAPVLSQYGHEIDDDDGATKVARVPESLLSASATGRVAAASSDSADEEVHFRQVFDEFVQKKKECGEPLANFTYDKFVQTLRKNKETIVARHGARSVRFAVYIKDGKAALKATPVKD